MNWILESPANLVLAAVLLFGAGLGFGGVTGKGWLLLNGLRRANGNGPDKGKKFWPCQECLAGLANLFPCKEHSGLAADVKHLVKGNEEIKGVLNELWGAVNELRKELRNR
jgi:hypothetical protein